MNKRTVFPVFVMSVSSIVTNVGHGSWVVPAFNERPNEILTKPSTPVCYIGSKKYLSLDTALDVAFADTSANKIFVIPGLGTDIRIENDHVLNSNDSLILPYDGENVLKEKGNNGTGFADNNSAVNRKTHIVLAKDKKLTINGVLTIGGINGSGSNPMGQASSSYCELTMEDSSSLEVTGKLNCYGFIKESGSSKIELQDGAVLTTPAVFYDYSSAGTALSIKNNGVFPFSKFDIPSIRPEMVFNYGSSLIGKIHLYGDSVGDINTDATIIGKSDAFLNMNNGSTISWKFKDESAAKTQNQLNTHSTEAKISGGGSFGNLGVTIKYYFVEYPINSKDYYLPIPYGYSVYIEDGANFTVPSSIKGVKFMPGSSLTCKSGGTITFDANAVFYQSNKASDGTTFSYVTDKAAKFVNNGSVNINGGFEANIETDSSKSSKSNLTLSMYYQSVTDCLEGTSKSVYTWGGATGLIYQDGKSTKASFEKETVYESSGGKNYWVQAGKTANDIVKVTIKADRVKSSSNTKGTFNLEAVLEPSEYDSTNVEYEWSVSGNKSGASISKNGAKAVVTTNANSTSEDIVYTINLTVNFDKTDGTKGKVTTSIELTAAKKSGSCLLPTAKVLMADGICKQARDVKTGDMVVSFNHETGKFEPNRVIVNVHANSKAEIQNVMHLEFSNGNSTDFIYQHSYFDKTLNKYVNLCEDNYDEYIGHDFVYCGNGNVTTTTLVSVSIEKVFTTLAAPVTATHLNLIVDDMLGMETAFGLFNIFEYDPDTLAFDKEKKEADIAKYGLLGYESFEKYCPKEMYDLLPCKYLGVSIGKGLITWDIFEDYINQWKEELFENQNEAALLINLTKSIRQSEINS